MPTQLYEFQVLQNSKKEKEKKELSFMCSSHSHKCFVSMCVHFSLAVFDNDFLFAVYFSWSKKRNNVAAKPPVFQNFIHIKYQLLPSEVAGMSQPQKCGDYKFPVKEQKNILTNMLYNT